MGNDNYLSLINLLYCIDLLYCINLEGYCNAK